MQSLLSPAGLARACARRPWMVIGAWVLALALAGVAAVGWLGGSLTSEFGLANDPESVRGQELLDARMPGANPVSETVVVRSETATVDAPAFRSVVERITADLAATPGAIASATNYYQAEAAGLPSAAQLVSADRHATLIPVAFAGGFDEGQAAYEAYREALGPSEADGFRILTVGDLSLDEQFAATAESDLQAAEGIGLPVALLILVVVFGALVAAGVPVVLALISLGVAVGLTAVVGRLFELSFFVVNMITMIGLAVGIDYALFVVERYREERRHGHPKAEAIAIAGGTAGKAVLFSGVTVVLALAGMFLVPTTIFRSLGTGAILVVIVAVLATLTFVPAMLSLLGDRIDWPRRRHVPAPSSRQAAHDREMMYAGFWGRVTRIVMTRPVVSVVLAVAALGALAMPYLDLERGQSSVATLPDSEVKAAFGILDRDFAAGRLAPVDIVVDCMEGDPRVRAGIEALTTILGKDPAFEPDPDVTWNASGDLALVAATLTMDADAPEAYAAVERLREHLVPGALAGVPAEALVAGDTAFNADFNKVVDDWTPRVFAFVLGLSFLLLLLAFRSIVVPVKAIAMNLLSVGAAYGLLVLVFQKGTGADLLGFQQTPVIEGWVPIFLYCVLFGLSMDYHVFLLSRIKEHFDHTRDNRASVAVGLQSTARIITGAALIMVVVFAGFAMGDLVMFQQMGFGLAVAVFLDATLVRSVLVPASMALLGDRNWYLPRWLHWLPDLRIEGAPAPAPAPVSAPSSSSGEALAAG